MKSLAISLMAVSVLLAGIIAWQQRDTVQRSQQITRDAPLSLWRDTQTTKTP